MNCPVILQLFALCSNILLIVCFSNWPGLKSSSLPLLRIIDPPLLMLSGSITDRKQFGHVFRVEGFLRLSLKFLGDIGDVGLKLVPVREGQDAFDIAKALRTDQHLERAVSHCGCISGQGIETQFQRFVVD